MNETLSIEKFSPTQAQLTELATSAKQIALPDLLDKAAVKVVHDKRMELRAARTDITKAGKALREDALAFQKQVIAKEKELIAIISPEEDRLADLEARAEEEQEREARRPLIPDRRAKIDDIEPQYNKILTDDQMLDMDGTEFQGFLNKCLADKNARDAAAIAEQKQQISEDQAKIDAEKKRLDDEKADRERKEKEEAEAKARKEKQEAEDKARQEEKERKQKADDRYQAFLKEHGYNRTDFYTTEDVGGRVTLWKKVATYIPNDDDF